MATVRDRFGVELRMCAGTRWSNRPGRVCFADRSEHEARLDQRRAVRIRFPADLERIATAAHAVDALFAVDIIQALGASRLRSAGALESISHRAASHKWLCAPEGCGILYVSDDARDRVEPAFVGWISVETPWDFEDREQPFKPNALAWESGTGARHFFMDLNRASKLLTETGLDKIENYLDDLSDYLCELLAGKDYKIVSSRAPGEKSPIVCIKHHERSGV